ncbi:MAG TPA: chemotaxis-specific protein-glutamate methyltransferase CheB [Rectinemataceae bacterium]|nr:chemotaxis-specific protein-glutamate methyltransferase CheB [Rectinemataceae bacterium]
MKIRVLVADDSAIARAVLRDILEVDPEIAVIGEARDGREAVDLARRLRPDIVTMDLGMPILDGMGAITEIMASNPLPILVVSSAFDAEKAYAAVQRGALEVLAKPDASDASRAELVGKVKALASAKVRTLPRQGGQRSAAPSPGFAVAASNVEAGVQPVFAIASSTGGPQALARILSALPQDFPASILIAQHISDGFAPGLVQWLSTITKLKVRLAAGGELPAAGEVYISPSESNLSLAPSGRLLLGTQVGRQVFHPLCDALLASVAAARGKRGVGIILTGMSEDGARGLAEIKASGGLTIAQDEASSVVFGMNKVAIERGAALKVLSIEDIAPEMCRVAGVAGR